MRHSPAAQQREAWPFERVIGEPVPGRATGLDSVIARRRKLVALLLGLGLLGVYQLDDSIVEEGDAIANVELPIALLRTGLLEFSPRISPIVFNWRSEPPLAERPDNYVRSWRERFNERPAGLWYATGYLRFNGPRYFVVKSPVREAYVCTFGIIPGLTMMPMAALLAAVDPNFVRSERLKLSAAKLHAGALVALSAGLIFLIGLRFVQGRDALLVALAYGLGTCVWAVSSETLWQQTVNLALLTGVAYTFLNIIERDSRRARWICGLLLGTALASRPTALFMALAIGWYIWRHRRPALSTVLLAALPIPAAIAVYNQYYFGSPFNFAQELVGHQIALEKTGIENVWQTPMVVGLAGLLFSPSRGLLVFSPFLAAAFWGVHRVWTEEKYGTLRPLTVAAGLTMALQCKWFDWWGGWTYGYRPWLEAMPVFAMCLLPVVEPILRRRWLTALVGAALAWSVFVQGLGAFAYDKHWNARDLHRVEVGERTEFFTNAAQARKYAQRAGGTYTGLFACNIDLKACRYRLWSIEDSIIAYYLNERYDVARDNRTPLGWSNLRNAP